MEQVIWIEVLSRHRQVVSRHRWIGNEVRIGRAYDNDIIIDDPHTAPHHLLIRAGEDAPLVAEDLGSANGLYLDRNRRRHDRVTLDGETLLRIGHTYLRVRRADHTVAPERVVTRTSRHWPLMLGLALGTVAIRMTALWLDETGEPVPSRYLEPLLMLIAAAILWAGVWAILARIFAEQTRFERHLLIALGGLFGYTLYSESDQFLAFAFSWPALAAFDYVAIWCVLAAVCFLHLRQIAPSRPFAKAAGLLVLMAIAITVQTVVQREDGATPPQTAYLRHLLPPGFHLAPLRSEDAFFGDVRELKGEIDKDRTKELSEPDHSDIRPTSD
jgi:Inner membrane component of T3SS, cytoplasmic domain